jgi:NAD-dependent dihydropyrimidine dehydrogenase PreA subunit
MKGETGEKDKRLAVLFQNFFDELVQSTQTNYDLLVSAFKNVPSIARIVPVEEEIDPKQEVVIPFEELSKIIEKQDTIGVATCYCRHRKDLLDDPCKKTDQRQNCFSFGRTAEFLISQDFMNPISVEQAMKILKKAEDDGLVHKAFHNNLDPEREIEGMCNCCKCCCGTFEMYHSGASPLNDLTSYLAEVDTDSCVGCGTCVENCNTEAIELIDTVALINGDKCIGCGVCAHLCPENSISLKRTGPRNVFILPPKLAQS